MKNFHTPHSDSFMPRADENWMSCTNELFKLLIELKEINWVEAEMFIFIPDTMKVNIDFMKFIRENFDDW